MHTAITEFIEHSGLSGVQPDASGRLSLRLESGTTINLEPDESGEKLIISVFYPSPWTLLEVGARALRRVHYREATARPVSAGIFEDRLVLSTRLNRSHQAPQEIERAAHELYALAEQCARQTDMPDADATPSSMERFAK